MNDNPYIAQLVRLFTPEGIAGTPPVGYGNEFLFLVGRDDVHGILKYLLTNEKLSLKENMFGYADDELNELIMNLIKDPNIHVQLSLDKSQAGGVHESKIIAADESNDPQGFATSVVILQSATHQISHTKGAVLGSQGLYFEGSTNWSQAGEGEGIQLKPGLHSIPGFKAQNNTLLVSANQINFRRFSTQLDVEHQVGLAAAAKAKITEGVS